MVFSFENRCAMFRPQIFDLLKLPQKTLVIDFDDYEPSVQDNQAIRSEINHQFDIIQVPTKFFSDIVVGCCPLISRV